MVHPNMATMFVFMTTDAEVAGGTLQKLLSATVADSFNLLSIDGDQSTSDTALLIANGASGTGLTPGGYGRFWRRFTRALQAVCRWLAQEIVRGGEGVTKSLRRDGAWSVGSGHRPAGGARSHDVVAGKDGDPWRRPKLGPDRDGPGATAGLSSIPTFLISGSAIPRSSNREPPAVYEESLVAEHFRQTDVTIEVALNQGEASATAWGGDLSAEYVAINAEYMT